jgi:hypothetical protein
MAPKAPSRDGITPYDTVVGQFLFTAAHEMGHAVFDFLDVPIFGRPEDAADQFAAYILLRIGKQDARKLIEGAAYMYRDYIGRPTCAGHGVCRRAWCSVELPAASSRTRLQDRIWRDQFRIPEAHRAAR